MSNSCGKKNINCDHVLYLRKHASEKSLKRVQESGCTVIGTMIYSNKTAAQLCWWYSSSRIVVTTRHVPIHMMHLIKSHGM
jgi:hypothetical protein